MTVEDLIYHLESFPEDSVVRLDYVDGKRHWGDKPDEPCLVVEGDEPELSDEFLLRNGWKCGVDTVTDVEVWCLKQSAMEDH